MKALIFIGNNDKRSLIQKPGHFAKLKRKKKSGRTEFFTMKKRTCPGKSGRMATLIQLQFIISYSTNVNR